MTKYTFTFGADEETKFRRIIDRLEPDEFTIIEDIHLTKPEDGRYSPRETIMDMDAEAALTFRLGMKNLKIRRERTEEELAEEKALLEKNKITITVQVPGLNPPTTPTP